MTKNPDAEKAKAARLEPIGVTPNRRAAHQAPRACAEAGLPHRPIPLAISRKESGAEGSKHPSGSRRYQGTHSPKDRSRSAAALPSAKNRVLPSSQGKTGLHRRRPASCRRRRSARARATSQRSTTGSQTGHGLLSRTQSRPLTSSRLLILPAFAALPDLSNQTATLALQRSAPSKLKEIFTNRFTILHKE